MSDALYEPMFDGAGNVVGLLFVGIPTRAYDTILSQALHMMCAVAGVVGTFVIFRRGSSGAPWIATAR
jgi:methyl-accepting chemotaxis protein